MKRPKDRLRKVTVIGATPAGIAATNKLGELGIPVTLVDSEANIDKKLSADEFRLESGIPLNFAHRPGLIRIMRNSSIKCILPARVNTIKHNPQGFSVSLTREPVYVDPEKCIMCGRCAEVCPVLVEENEKAVRFEGRFSLPGRPVIDKRRMPLCRENCPLGVNAQGYVALAKEGRYLEALDLIRQHNILPGVCGRICTHPCETDCRRGQVDDPVSIRAIKRFLSDYGADHKDEITPPEPAEQRPETFAVIGSGPAGLSAAARLARAGCGVTVFDKESRAGGMLRYGIGPHRLPRHILDAELEYIEKLGVTFELSHPVDPATDLDTIKKHVDGVILTTGSWKDKTLGATGEDLDGVLGCVDFLARFYRGEIKELNQKVAVIGDGNAAFDLARTLCRIGANVTIVSWFRKDRIPADAEEIVAAKAEGIEIIDQYQVVAFNGENGKFRNLVVKATQPGPPDENGIEWPKIVENAEPEDLEFDLAFVAIGQAGSMEKNAGIGVNDFGYLEIDDKGMTTVPAVYAAGDAATGPSTVVHAMASGRTVADQVLFDICGIPMPLESQRPADREFPEIPEHEPTRHRVAMPEARPVSREGNFSEVALGLSETDVLREAGRCLQCGVCSECMQCRDVCAAIGAISHDEPVEDLVEQSGVVIIADPAMAPNVRGEDVIRAYGPKTSKPDVYAMMMRGFAAAAQAMVWLDDRSHARKGHGVSFAQPDSALSDTSRIGVFVCKCNDSLGWRDEMDQFVQGLTSDNDVVHAEVLNSACVPDGVSSIVRTVRDKGITRIVLGSCACCPLNFACSACTEQRSRLKHNLFTATGISRSMVVTRNIRGEALSLLNADPDQALSQFTGILNRSVKSSKHLKSFPSPARNYNFATAVIGGSEAAAHCALTLAGTGMDVFMFPNADGAAGTVPDHSNIHCFEGRLDRFSGTLGDFRIDVQSGDFNQSIRVGAVILGEKSRKTIEYVRQEDMPPRGINRNMQKKGVPGIPFFYPAMTSISGLFLADPPGIHISNKLKGEACAMLAAAVMPRGPRKSKGYTVFIDKEVCRNCGRCADACPYQAITLHENEIGGWFASVDEAFCKGCGNCISVCPSNAADSPYRNQVFFEKTLENILLQ